MSALIDKGAIQVRNDLFTSLFYLAVSSLFTWQCLSAAFSGDAPRLTEAGVLNQLFFAGIVLFLFSFVGYSLYLVFDRRVKLTINSAGIWSKDSNQIYWNEISSFRTSTKHHRGGTLHKLFFSLTDGDVRIIEYYQYDISFEQIDDLISVYAQQYGIQKLT